jgi:hypothetical protein
MIVTSLAYSKTESPLRLGNSEERDFSRLPTPRSRRRAAKGFCRNAVSGCYRSNLYARLCRASIETKAGPPGQRTSVIGTRSGLAEILLARHRIFVKTELGLDKRTPVFWHVPSGKRSFSNLSGLSSRNRIVFRLGRRANSEFSDSHRSSLIYLFHGRHYGRSSYSRCWC